MPDDPLTHRGLAVAAFNACCTLLVLDRTDAEDLELLEVAFTSRHHWREVGGAQQVAIADWMVSRCFAELGEGPLALRFATAALDAGPDDAPAWLRASLLEGLARAHAAAGDQAGRDLAEARAREALATEPDQEDRAIVESQLDSLPPAR